MTRTAARPSPPLPMAVAGLLPALLAVAVAWFVPAPWSLVPLLLAVTLALAGVRHANATLVERGGWWRAGGAHLALTAALLAWSALLLSWPLAALRAVPSLGASLLVSVAALLLLASLWRLWPLPALLLRAPWLPPRSAFDASVALTRDPEHLLWLLPAGLACLAPVVAALALARIGPFAVHHAATGFVVFAVLVIVAGAVLVRSVAALERLVAHAGEPPSHGTRSSQQKVRLSAAETLPGVREEALLNAARGGDVDKALALLDAGADPEAQPEPDQRDQRPLVMLAAQLDDSRLLRALIAAGVDFRASHGGITPLHAATRDSLEGRPETVAALLANGADPRAIDGDGNTPLHAAALGHDAGVAAMLLDAGAEADAVNRAGLSPLAVACRAGNWDMATFLLGAGAASEPARGVPALIAAAGVADDDAAGVGLLLKRRARVNATDALGRSALMTAALEGNAAVAAALLAARADVNAVDQRGTSALMEAARAGADAVIAALAPHKPRVDARDVHGRDALVLACQSPRAGVDTVRALLALGADPHAPAGDGRDAVDHAAADGRWNLVAALDPDQPLPAAHCGDLEPEPGADSPEHLLDALRFGHWAAVSGFHNRAREWPAAERARLYLELDGEGHGRARRWLLERDLDAETRLADGERLIDAVLARLPASLEALEELLARGASVAGAGLLARTMAALGDSAVGAALVPRLVELGADPFGSDGEGKTPLHHAAANAIAPALAALLARGCDPDARDREGLTPLHHALLGEHAERAAILRGLIRAGANPEVGGGNGETPLGLALASGEAEAVRWLRWHPWGLPGRALRGEDLSAAAARGDEAAVARLLELGFDVNSRDARGATALMRAAGSGQRAAAKCLLAAGADVAAVSRGGATALSAAVSARQSDLVDELLAHGADVDQRLQGGATALMVAAALGRAAVAEVLIAHGADVNVKDDKGRGALHAAAQFCFGGRDSLAARRILDVLLGHGADSVALDARGASVLLFMLGGFTAPGSGADATHIGALLPVLLDAGAPVNAADQRGVTPLHCCAIHALIGPARTLLARGADRAACDNHARTPADVARLLGYVDVARELGGAMTIPGADATLRQPSRDAAAED